MIEFFSWWAESPCKAAVGVFLFIYLLDVIRDCSQAWRNRK
jgi:hypothetical protein